MTKYECQDCDYETMDEARAESHQRETDHCMADPVEVPDEDDDD